MNNNESLIDNVWCEHFGHKPSPAVVRAVQEVVGKIVTGKKFRARRSDPSPSHIAASAPQSGNRKLVLDAVTAYGSEGITADELAIIFGHAKGLHRRLPELERMGWIARSGTRLGTSGVPNTVWVRTNQTIGHLP